VWSLRSGDQRVVGLYTTGLLEVILHDVLHDITPAGIRFLAWPPGIADNDPEAMTAGLSLPGWYLTFEPLDMTPFETASRRQTVVYALVAVAGLGAITILAVAAARTFRRHLRLTRLRTDLVSAVSHELRTPIASMRVLVDGLLADERLEPQKAREYLGMLATEQARLSRVIENFLAFSRAERARQPFLLASTPPSSIVSAAVDAIRERLPRDCDLRVAVDSDLPPVLGDGEALATALVNLLDNALKYTPERKEIEIRAYRAGTDAVAFAVGDNGIGIPRREHRRIFRRFYQTDQRLARTSGGVGLGLSIVQLIVRAHGGTVDVQSEAGVGSIFTFRVPCAREGVAA
jgi:signal transduction histidine kinase